MGIMMAMNEIENEVRRSLYTSPGGRECIFIKLPSNIGIKCYASRKKRDTAHFNQKRAHSIGLGPEVGRRIKLDIALSRKQLDKLYDATDSKVTWIIDYYGGLKGLYCYETEIVETVFKGWESPKERVRWAMENRAELDEVVERLWNEADFDFYDDHGFNWGIKDGKYIPVDFGMGS